MFFVCFCYFYPNMAMCNKCSVNEDNTGWNWQTWLEFIIMYQWLMVRAWTSAYPRRKTTTFKIKGVVTLKRSVKSQILSSRCCLLSNKSAKRIEKWRPKKKDETAKSLHILKTWKISFKNIWNMSETHQQFRANKIETMVIESNVTRINNNKHEWLKA